MKKMNHFNGFDLRGEHKGRHKQNCRVAASNESTLSKVDEPFVVKTTTDKIKEMNIKCASRCKKSNEVSNVQEMCASTEGHDKHLTSEYESYINDNSSVRENIENPRDGAMNGEIIKETVKGEIRSLKDHVELKDEIKAPKSPEDNVELKDEIKAPEDNVEMEDEMKASENIEKVLIESKNYYMEINIIKQENERETNETKNNENKITPTLDQHLFTIKNEIDIMSNEQLQSKTSVTNMSEFPHHVKTRSSRTGYIQKQIVNKYDTRQNKNSKMKGFKDTHAATKGKDLADSSDNIEEQLGKLPELTSDDEKERENSKPVVKTEESKPVIKQDPDQPCLTQSDLEKLKELCEGSYTLCDVHKAERMDRTIVCIPCRQLICPICLLHFHQTHNIQSVSSLKEYFKVKKTVEDNVFELQQEHLKLKQHLKDRMDLSNNIKGSSQKLISEIESRFNAIKAILQAKQEHLIKYVKHFESQNLSEISQEMDKIRDYLNNSSTMITRAIAFFSKIDIKQADTLPLQVAECVKLCKCSNIQTLQNTEKHLPEKKFSKLLPSLDAVASICDTIHAEATKVVWKKTSKHCENEEKKGTREKAEKRKHHSHSSDQSDKNFKKPKTTAVSSSSSHRRTSTDNTDTAKKNGDTDGAKSGHRKSVDSTSSQSSKITSDESESEKTDTPPRLKLVELKSTNVEIGKCLLAKVADETESEEKFLIGKVSDSSKMKDTTQYNVNWFKGEVGKDTSFEIKKNVRPVHSSAVICSFQFDHTKPMTTDLTNELLQAKEYYLNKKTKKRKSVAPRDKSQKKDTSKSSKADK